MKKKSIALLMALVLVVGGVIGGTVAWLIAAPQTVTNTFTVGAIEIELHETLNAKSDSTVSKNDIWTAQLVPGTTYAKDPKVAVIAPTNVDSYLFVQLDKVNNPDTYLDYTLNLEGWKAVGGKSNAWYREVPKAQVVEAKKYESYWNLISGNKVTVKKDLVESEMPTLEPQLTFKACAVQKDNLTVEEAWAIADPLLNPAP